MSIFKYLILIGLNFEFCYNLFCSEKPKVKRAKITNRNDNTEMGKIKQAKKNNKASKKNIKDEDSNIKIGTRRDKIEENSTKDETNFKKKDVEIEMDLVLFTSNSDDMCEKAREKDGIFNLNSFDQFKNKEGKNIKEYLQDQKNRFLKIFSEKDLKIDLKPSIDRTSEIENNKYLISLFCNIELKKNKYQFVLKSKPNNVNSTSIKEGKLEFFNFFNIICMPDDDLVSSHDFFIIMSALEICNVWKKNVNIYCRDNLYKFKIYKYEINGREYEIKDSLKYRDLKNIILFFIDGNVEHQNESGLKLYLEDTSTTKLEFIKNCKNNSVDCFMDAVFHYFLDVDYGFPIIRIKQFKEKCHEAFLKYPLDQLNNIFDEICKEFKFKVINDVNYPDRCCINDTENNINVVVCNEMFDNLESLSEVCVKIKSIPEILKDSFLFCSLLINISVPKNSKCGDMYTYIEKYIPSEIKNKVELIIKDSSGKTILRNSNEPISLKKNSYKYILRVKEKNDSLERKTEYFNVYRIFFSYNREYILHSIVFLRKYECIDAKKLHELANKFLEIITEGVYKKCKLFFNMSEKIDEGTNLNEIFLSNNMLMKELEGCFYAYPEGTEDLFSVNNLQQLQGSRGKKNYKKEHDITTRKNGCCCKCCKNCNSCKVN